MNLEGAIYQLQQQGEAIITLASVQTDDEVRWKPAPGCWSILEVLNHLVDEEVLDFRHHLDHILHTPDAPWPEIDPQGWVTEKKYNETQLERTLQTFQAERENSIQWLKKLSEPKWHNKVDFSWGSLSAGDMLAAWLAHDLLHLRQLIELRYQLTLSAGRPFNVEYAGKW